MRAANSESESELERGIAFARAKAAAVAAAFECLPRRIRPRRVLSVVFAEFSDLLWTRRFVQLGRGLGHLTPTAARLSHLLRLLLNVGSHSVVCR